MDLRYLRDLIRLDRGTYLKQTPLLKQKQNLLSIMRNILQPDPMWSEERNGVIVLYQIYMNWNGWKYDSEALVNSNGLRLNNNTKTNALQ